MGGMSEQGKSGLLWSVFAGDEGNTKNRIATFAKREDAIGYIKLLEAIKACVVAMGAVSYSNRGDAVRIKSLLQKIEDDKLIPGISGRGEGE
jgi:hypothetical protein